MKKSTLKTLLAASIVYLAIIAVIVLAYTKVIDTMKKNTAKTVTRIQATEDIVAGDLITTRNVTSVTTQDVLRVKGLLYKMYANEAKDEEGKTIKQPVNDGLYALGKVATQNIYAGEWLTSDKVVPAEEIYDINERLYAVPFDANTTGGYNVSKGEYVDIAVLYNASINLQDARLNNTIREIYGRLQPNQITDIVLAKRLVEDIRDETGTSVTENSATKPGFICFRLTYEEINKLEWARQCGTLFIGKAKDYVNPALVETFMKDMAQPNIAMVPQEELPAQLEEAPQE
ncbi:MAG: hypothetical protein IJS47_06765 [Clostridia bacterium]|nr:hypothetical protein [Clostridia bacterium]